jgi:hypothetical protein
MKRRPGVGAFYLEVLFFLVLSAVAYHTLECVKPLLGEFLAHDVHAKRSVSLGPPKCHFDLVREQQSILEFLSEGKLTV